jgi:hypothetical protein
MHAIGQSHGVIQGTESECFRSSEATSVGAPEGVRVHDIVDTCPETSLAPHLEVDHVVGRAGGLVGEGRGSLQE